MVLAKEVIELAIKKKETVLIELEVIELKVMVMKAEETRLRQKRRLFSDGRVP